MDNSATVHHNNFAGNNLQKETTQNVKAAIILEKNVLSAYFLCLPNFVRLERKCGEIVFACPPNSPKQFRSLFCDYLSVIKEYRESLKNPK